MPVEAAQQDADQHHGHREPAADTAKGSRRTERISFSARPDWSSISPMNTNMGKATRTAFSIVRVYALDDDAVVPPTVEKERVDLEALIELQRQNCERRATFPPATTPPECR